MVSQFVRITTTLAHEEVRFIVEERAPRLREVQGLLQMYLGYDPDSVEPSVAATSLTR